jgi:tetratricopeptide (TPR) repeat protein
MIKQQEFFEYLKTISITLLVIFVSVIALLFVIQHRIYEKNVQTQVEENTIDYNLIDVMIKKNQALEIQSPSNYKINLKLGTLYEIKKDYKNAEAQYLKAIDKAPCIDHKPQYRLALLYLHINKLEKAEAVMDKISDEPDKILIKYKADIYEKLGDSYYNFGSYDDAIDRYEKSLFYWQILKDRKEIAYIQNSLASSYVYLADQDVSNMQPQDAINSLKNALSMFNVPILKYKLALLLMTNDPDVANQYFEEVYKKAPELINYDTYSNFLSAMADEANANGDTAQAQLYQYKQKKLKEFFETNILSVDDIVLEDVEAKIKPNNWLRKNNISLEAKLRNVSKNSIESLFIEIVFKDKNVIIGDYTEQVADKKSPLLSGNYSPLISIKVSQPIRIRDVYPKTVTAEIYASKTAGSLKLHLTTVGIKEQIKPRKPNKFLMWFGRMFDEITSKLPSFLF